VVVVLANVPGNLTPTLEADPNPTPAPEVLSKVFENPNIEISINE
jgi:hypothetical protein